jgi:hypothetical protein
VKRIVPVIAVTAAGYVASIVLANWLSNHYGLVPAGFGLMVSAGTYSAALALGLRDWLHEVSVPEDATGWRTVPWIVFAAICIGVLVSYFISTPRLAAASGVAFGLSEIADLLVYTPLRHRQRSGAILASNIVGSIADTLLFLGISGFGITSRNVGGQLLVKAVWVTGGFLLFDFILRFLLDRRREEVTA